MKRSPVLLKLSREHHTALVLALRIAQANDPAALAVLMVKVPAVFRNELEPHFQEEERDLLPRLATAGEALLVERTLEEHRQMRDLIVRVSGGEPDALKAFGELLKAHVQFEERALFVTAQAVLPSAYLDQHV